MSVTRADLLAAQKPLLDLLGLSSEDVFAEGVTIHRDHVSVTVRARFTGDTQPRSALLNRVVGLAPAPSQDAALAWTFDVPIIQPEVAVA